MKPSKKLDIVLGIIAKVDEFIDSKSIYSEIPEEIKPKELTPIINKLVIDGYVEKKLLMIKVIQNLHHLIFAELHFLA